MSNHAIYRSVEFGKATRWNHPLKRVEVVVQDDDFAIYIYDVGFEPPYYDATPLPTIFSKPADNGLEGAETVLRKKGIVVEQWREVENFFLHECNAIMRSEIRADIDDVYQDVDKQRIEQQVAAEAIEALSRYNGHSVLLHALFLEKAEVDKLCSYANYGYVMFRTPSSHGSWGFVCKTSQDGITVLIKADDNLTCMLYDQATRSNMTKGDVVQMRFDLITDDNSFILDHGGLRSAK